MTLRQLLLQGRQALTEHHIEDAPLESEVLLRHTLGLDRVQLYTDLDRSIKPAEEETFRGLIRRRISGEPAAYITGHKEFYGLDFEVDRNVLIPRPETELLVEKVLAPCRSHSIQAIADVGTGCGAVAVTLALNLPQAKIFAIDISPAALAVARRNAAKHGVSRRITFLPGDMLEPLPEKVDLIVANLPYVKQTDIPPTGPLSFEPAIALNGGADGLDKIKELCRQARDKLSPGGCLLLEIGQGQHEAVAGLLDGLFPSASLEISRDLQNIERVVSLCLTSGPL